MSGIKNFLWPYDEISFKRSENELKIEAPWVKLTFPFSPEQSQYQKFTSIRQKGPKSADDIKLVDSILRYASKYPVYFCLPNHTKQYLGPMTGKASTLKKCDDFQWNALEIKEFSMSQPKLNDPVSALSYLRLNHLKDLTEKYSKPKTRNLADLEGNNLKTATLMYIRQNHYVTQKCETVLTPALTLHTKSKPEIEHFIKEEKGHDKLLSLSLNRLNRNPEELDVLPSLIKMMDFFKTAAETNLLAFCFIVDMFERSPEAKDNPIVTALHKMDQAHAAQPIESHANINHTGGHEHESIDILESVGLISDNDLFKGIQMAERASDLMINFLNERQSKIAP